MIFLRRKAYVELISEAALAQSMAVRVSYLEDRIDKLLDTILALKAAGAELPPGHGEEGWGKYVMDEVEEETPGAEALVPGPEAPEEEDPEVLLDIARALGVHH